MKWGGEMGWRGDRVGALSGQVERGTPSAGRVGRRVFVRSFFRTPLIPMLSVFGSRRQSVSGPWTRTPEPSAPPSASESFCWRLSLRVRICALRAPASASASADAAPSPAQKIV